MSSSPEVIRELSTRASAVPVRVDAVKAAVLGAGSWGTTFAKVLVDAGTETLLWARRPELARKINEEHANTEYLAGIGLPAALRATSDAQEALAGADLVVIVLPAQSARANLREWVDHIPRDASLVSLMKGIELRTTRRMSEVIAESTGAEVERVLVLSGPNLAREIAEEQPTATVIASADAGRATQLQIACSAPYFRPYTNSDVIGTELAGAIKNVIALACGMAAGMGFGDNTLASLITRGLAETSRLGVALGADPATFAGLAGLGDLVATCASPLSRNRAFGVRLGRGDTVSSAQQAIAGQVAEGVKSCLAVLDLADRHGVDVPITRQVAAVCQGHTTPADAVSMLMRRSVKSE